MKKRFGTLLTTAIICSSILISCTTVPVNVNISTSIDSSSSENTVLLDASSLPQDSSEVTSTDLPSSVPSSAPVSKEIVSSVPSSSLPNKPKPAVNPPASKAVSSTPKVINEPVSSQFSEPEPPPEKDIPQVQTIYITRTGARYHYLNPCGNGTYYKSTLSEAQRRGLTPCKKCVL